MNFNFLGNYFTPVFESLRDPVLSELFPKLPTESFQIEPTRSQVVSIHFQRFYTGIFKDFDVSAPLVSVLNDPEPMPVSQPTAIQPPTQTITPTPTMIESLQSQPVINNIYTTRAGRGPSKGPLGAPRACPHKRVLQLRDRLHESRNGNIELDWRGFLWSTRGLI